MPISTLYSKPHGREDTTRSAVGTLIKLRAGTSLKHARVFVALAQPTSATMPCPNDVHSNAMLMYSLYAVAYPKPPCEIAPWNRPNAGLAARRACTEPAPADWP